MGDRAPSGLKLRKEMKALEIRVSLHADSVISVFMQQRQLLLHVKSTMVSRFPR